jgi:hypothetical protein
MSDDTYFFEVSVAEHPQSKKRMNELAKSVVDAQTEMTKAVSMVGDAASASFKNIGSLLDGIESLERGGVGAMKAIQAEVRALQDLTRQKIVQQVEVVHKDVGSPTDGNETSESLPTQQPVSRLPSGNGSDPSDYTDRLRQSQTEEKAILDRKVNDHADANAKIKSGVQAVGNELDALRTDAAKPIIQKVDVQTSLADAAKPLVQKVDVVADDELDRMRSESAKPIVQKVSIETTRTTNAVGTTIDPSDYTDDLRESQVAESSILGRKVQDQADASSRIKQSIGSIGDELDALRSEAVNPIVQTVEVKTTQTGSQVPPASVSQPTSGLTDYSDALSDSHVKDKQVWEAKVQTQKEAFERAASEYDKAVATQHKSSDEMNKAVLKGARGLLDAGKGWAQLGLIGEENSKKLVEGLILVEGAFNIAKGGVEFLEAFGQGWKAVRSSQEAANNVSKITASLRSAEFAQLRAYHLSLVQEAEAASLAAGANMRLAGSRTAAGMAAGTGAAATVAGTATSVGAGAVGTAAAVGGAPAAAAAWNTVGGVAVSGAVAIGAFVAAVAGAGFGLRSLYDVVTGTGKELGSFNDTIASWEAGVGASMLSLTGMFTSLDDPSTQFAQSLAVNVDGLLAYGRSMTEGVYGSESFFNALGLATGALGDFATLAASNATLAKAEKRAVQHKIQTEFTDAQENVKRDGGNDKARLSFENRNTIRTIDAGDDKSAQLAAATERQLDAAKMLAEQTRKMGDLEAQNLEHTEDYLDAEREAIRYRKELSSAITEQGKLQSDITKSEIDGQKKVQEEVKKKIEESKKGLEALESKQQGAVENFAKMDKLQQVMASNALIQARAQGGASLNDKQKDLLRSVGTDEAKRLASEGDKAEANAVGFDRTFGSGFEADRMAIEQTQKSLEAELSTKFDFTLKTESNLESMLGQLKDAAKSAASEENKKAIEQVSRMMQEGFAKASQDRDQQLRTRNRQG